jgi:hypothetical protein
MDAQCRSTVCKELIINILKMKDFGIIIAYIDILIIGYFAVQLKKFAPAQSKEVKRRAKSQEWYLAGREAFRPSSQGMEGTSDILFPARHEGGE